MPRHYNEFVTVPATYKPTMTREAINETPETWMDFYPHATFVKLLNTMFDETRSVWITGNFGTGKSNASLVIQKLFMDDQARVTRWFNDKHGIIVNADSVKERLFEARQQGTLVIYDYNASGIAPHEEFLVRLEKGVLAALDEYGYSVPSKGNLETVISRIRREGQHFFETRDSMLPEMKSLKADVNNIEQLVSLLREESASRGYVPTHYLEDVQSVLHKDNIYLSIDVPSFRAWIHDILKANNLHRIIYIFDEFSEFIDENSNQLKTFEDVAEAPDINHFYLVPVTHKEPAAFLGENAPGAKRARDRFYFRDLRMPNDIAFQLAGDAMKIVEENRAEWEGERTKLWASIATVVDSFDDPNTSASYVSREAFQNILPIHPMAAFLLKFLAEHARSNQRSLFEYLKGSADGREFQEFIAKGGPSIINAQFLTPDYLWKYFMERSDAGQSHEITDIKLEYDRIVNREFRNYGDDHAEIRILKTVMLFSLLSKLASDGHKRLLPTTENVELSFRGDGTIMDVNTILSSLATQHHCFSIVNGKIELYTSSIGGEERDNKIAELTGQFYELLHTKCEQEFVECTKNARSCFSKDRFELRVSDEAHTTLSNITAATRDKYSQGIAKDNGSICLWFVIAKDKADQFRVRERIDSLLGNLREHRILMLSFPNNTFCKDNTNLWNEYVSLYAQYLLENNSTAKAQIKKSVEGVEANWFRVLKSTNTSIDVAYYDTESNGIRHESCSWPGLKSFLNSYNQLKLPACPDLLTDQITVFNNTALKGWALAGIRFTGQAQMGQLVKSLKEKGISSEAAWFDAHPNHVLSQIKKLLKKKYDNTVGNGSDFSLRKAWIELQRAPFGMRYNCLSAFVLGFCSAWLLEKNCQWTNKQITQSLNEETLAEIIEATVAGKTDKEKLICRLSREDKAFAEKVPCLFGLTAERDSTPLQALERVSSEIEASSCKVPLWILADYIRTEHPEHLRAAEILDHLCVALRISSKGRNDEKVASITEIGKAILEDTSIVSTVASYTKSDTYIQAFRSYVDRADAELPVLAEAVEDYSHQYCDVILDHMARTAGWLWNQSDITSVIAVVHQRYKVIELGRDLLALNGYASYEDIVARISDKINRSGIPVAIVGDKYPAAERFIRGLCGGGDASHLAEDLRGSKDILKELYCDPQKKLAIALVRERLGQLAIDDGTLASMLTEVSQMVAYNKDIPIEAYIQLFNKLLEKSERNTLVAQAKQEWLRISGSETLESWANEVQIPAWSVFANQDNRANFIKLLSRPEDFSTEALKQQLSLLQDVPEVSLKQCQTNFQRTVVPQRYANLGLTLGSIVKYLTERYGADPNRWPEHPDIETFVRDQYKVEIAPSVVRQLSRLDANELKEQLLELAKNDPDIGLRFLEV